MGGGQKEEGRRSLYFNAWVAIAVGLLVVIVLGLHVPVYLRYRYERKIAAEAWRLGGSVTRNRPAPPWPMSMLADRWEPYARLFYSLDGVHFDDAATDGGNFKAALPPEMAAKVKHRVDRKVYLGIRPKAFVLKERAVKADAGVSIRGRVDVSEMVGEEVLVHLASGEHQFTVSVSPHNRPVLVGDLEVCPILSLAHVFDGETEENLTMPDYITGSGKASEAKRSGGNGVAPEQGPAKEPRRPDNFVDPTGPRSDGPA